MFLCQMLSSQACFQTPETQKQVLEKKTAVDIRCLEFESARQQKYYAIWGNFGESLGFKFDFVGEFDVRTLTLGMILVNPWASLMLCFWVSGVWEQAQLDNKSIMPLGVIFDEFLGFKFDFIGEFDIRPLTLGVILVNLWASLILIWVFGIWEQAQLE